MASDQIYNPWPLRDEGHETLFAAATRGDRTALTECAVRLLAEPDRRAEALAALNEAMAKGDDVACLVSALLTLLAPDLPDSMERGLMFLTGAAERGNAAARVQLAILAAQQDQPHDLSDPQLWGRLAQAVDLKYWATPAVVNSLCEAPRVRGVDGLLPLAVCSWLMTSAAQNLIRASIYDNEKLGLVIDDQRNNSLAQFTIRDLDVIAILVRKKIAATAGAKLENLEPTSILHYRTGQRFTPHYDFLNPDLPGTAAALEREGQRILTFLVYLNTDFEGGETEFPRAGFKIRCAPGSAFFFHNTLEDGQLDWMSQHAGMAPTSGEKWIVSQFIRDRPFNSM